MNELTKAFRRAASMTPSARRRVALGPAYYKGARPRSERRGVPLPPVPPLADPMASLGHPPRGRKHHG